MKNKFRGLVILITTGLLISSCQDKEKDKSPVITQTFELEAFKDVELSIPADVRIIEGANQKVEITGPTETMSRINKTVESDTWNIELPRNYNKSYDNLNIVITSNEIEKTIVSGSGSMRIDSSSLLSYVAVSGSGSIRIDSGLLLSYVAVSGSGDINAKTEATTLKSKISGSGSITVSGNVDTLKCSFSGSGSFHGFDLKAEDVKINRNGSGNTEVFATTNLDMKKNGSGNIYYKGSPSVIMDVSGSGQIISVD